MFYGFYTCKKYKKLPEIRKAGLFVLKYMPIVRSPKYNQR